LIDLLEARRSIQVELRVEGGEVAGEVGVVVGIDDGDGLTGAVQRQLVEPIRVANFRGREAGGDWPLE
jgi:hypothetical protein